jgi:UDP-2,4-diacetamido-2,4,6-trideoxy-beta-L-altropyranose hydrolase
MNIFIRTDASVLIGSGHVMRCLTLAQELRDRGNDVQFICREHVGHLAQIIKVKKFNVILLPQNSTLNIFDYHPVDKKNILGVSEEQDAEQTSEVISDIRPDWVIVDHYALGAIWHSYIYNYCNNIMVIDDLANRHYECDILLDQTYRREKFQYQKLVPKKCKVYTGSNYALLRTEFLKLREQSIESKKYFEKVQHILVSMGGTDPDNVTEIILKGLFLVSWSRIVTVDIVLGDKAPHIKAIKEINNSDSIKINVITNTNNMAKLMLNADIAFGAGGTTTWERCCLGLPSLLVISAENQVDIVNNLQSDGVIINLGWHSKLESLNIKELVEKLIEDNRALLSMSKKGFNVCDGLGTQRVASNLEKYLTIANKSVALRPATLGDTEVIFKWQVSHDTRRYFINTIPPTYDEHRKWMKQKIQNNKDYFNIILFSGVPSGVLRIEKVDDYHDGYLISILVAPEFRSKGVGKSALILARDFLPKSKFYAEVSKENKASINLFLNAGYIFHDLNKCYISSPA